MCNLPPKVKQPSFLRTTMICIASRRDEVAKLHQGLREKTQELEEAQQIFKAAFEQAAVGIGVLALDGTFLELNETYRRLIGYHDCDFTGLKFQDITHPDDLTQDAGKIHDLISGKLSNYLRDKRYIHRDGKIVWASISVSVIRDKLGQPLRFVAAAKDITDKKAAEQELLRLNNDLEERVRQRTRLLAEANTALQVEIEARKISEQQLQEAKQKADFANETKNIFLANISHELRTPLGIILGFADLLVSKLADKLEPDEKAWLDTIVRNGQNLRDLIEDLLDLTRIEAGKIDIHIQETDLRGLLKEIVAIFTLKSADKNIALHLDIADDLPKTIHTDPLRVKQILQNLIGNAIKFTQYGSVAVTATQRVEGGQKQLVIQVTDTGIGIENAAHSNLFQPFSQANRTISKVFGGTGLGLSLSQKLSRALQGDIVLLRSKQGEGSTFEFSLKIPPHSTEATDSRPNQTLHNIQNRLRDLNILLVEDSYEQAEITSSFLKQAGGKVIIVSNGQDCLKQIKDHDFDLILMDLQMPDMNGYQTAAKVRDAGFKKPIIAFSAYAMKSEQEKCFTYGFNKHIGKPIDRTSLINTIADTVSTNYHQAST